MPLSARCRILFLVACSGLLLLVSVVADASEPLAGVGTPPLVAALEDVSGADFCGEPVPLFISDVRERFEKEMLVSLWRRHQVLLWLKRADRYFPVIEQVLADQGLPDDLKYIAVIESALRPHIGSPKGAIGFWQFMAPTARQYGLTVDVWRDERRNIFDSTRAAAAYLTELKERFGTWTLAAAGYNMGEERLEAEIAEQGVQDYYELYLPLETQRYVLRVIAAKLILTNPARYGFALPPEARWAPLSYRRVSIVCERETPIRLVAEAAGTTFKRIKDLNPELRGHYLGRGPVDILIPAPAPETFYERFDQLQKDYLVGQKGRVYVVRKGDNLSLIAERFDVSLSSLLIWNRLDPRRTIHPGDRLMIYPEVEEAVDEGPAEAAPVE